MNEPVIRIAESDADIAACLPVIKELRPHLTTEAEFIARVRRQRAQAGYQLAFARTDEVVAVGGFRVGEYLAWGMAMYVDDLVTTERGRSHGFGGALLGWLFEHARRMRCDQVHLDSGVQRFGAHRFYLRNGMDITSHHFAIRLE
ncbi:MAG: GNAT family N-acetyltransferase [Phycisphaerales bacterium]|nr:GNAT family N-acetyltransferase [Phycisphaerales bacterium]